MKKEKQIAIAKEAQKIRPLSVSLSAMKWGTFAAWEAAKGIREAEAARAKRAGASESLGRGEVVLRVPGAKHWKYLFYRAIENLRCV